MFPNKNMENNSLEASSSSHEKNIIQILSFAPFHITVRSAQKKSDKYFPVYSTIV